MKLIKEFIILELEEGNKLNAALGLSAILGLGSAVDPASYMKPRQPSVEKQMDDAIARLKHSSKRSKTVNKAVDATENETPETRTSTRGYSQVGLQFKPGSQETIELFRLAARRIGAPVEWAESDALHMLLSRESNGYVGRPNYTYGDRAELGKFDDWCDVLDEIKSGQRSTRSTATGLGQLIISNVDEFYPSGRAGMGVATEEAAGMLEYIRARYGTPEDAWEAYGTNHEGY